MPIQGMTAEEIGRLGEAMYDRDLRARVEPEHDGKFLVIDVLSGDYEIDADEMAADRRLKARRPDGAFFLIRVGYPAAYWFGGIRRGGRLMIVGAINDRGEPAIRLRLIGPGGQSEEILAAIDTGFNGPISLPPTLIEWLSLPSHRAIRVHLADGSSRLIEGYAVGVLWDGERRDVLAFAMGDMPLVGMALLKGHRLTIDAVDGGPVTIGPIA